MLVDENTPETLLPAEDVWPTLTLEELFRCKNILFDRWSFLVQKGYPYATNLKQALDRLEVFIENKLLSPQSSSNSN